MGELIPYPTGIVRLLMRLPVLFYRLGLGDVMNAARFLMLTTRGRRTGLARATPVEYRRHGNKLYVISGWGKRPHWFQNLLADPVVTVQQGRHVFPARASVVDSRGEALRVLHLFRKAAPFVYDAVLARLSNQPAIDVKTLPDVSGDFTIVRLDRLDDDTLTLPPVQADMGWMLPTGLIFLTFSLALLLFTRRGDGER
jgi:deazaflavin-dependent oxidoreductase (nitroreductase family)